MKTVQGIIVAAMLASGCASSPPPAPVVVTKTVYVYVPERSGPPVPPSEGIAPSPLLVEAEQRREEHSARLPVPAPPQDSVVYVQRDYGLGYGYGWRAPYPSSVIVVSERHAHADHRHHVDHHEHVSKNTERRRVRAAGRCERRATEWSRDRCHRGAAQK
jgi:hypothetical protein